MEIKIEPYSEKDFLTVTPPEEIQYLIKKANDTMSKTKSPLTSKRMTRYAITSFVFGFLVFFVSIWVNTVYLISGRVWLAISVTGAIPILAGIGLSLWAGEIRFREKNGMT